MAPDQQHPDTCIIYNSNKQQLHNTVDTIKTHNKSLNVVKRSQYMTICADIVNLHPSMIIFDDFDDANNNKIHEFIDSLVKCDIGINIFCISNGKQDYDNSDCVRTTTRESLYKLLSSSESA